MMDFASMKRRELQALCKRHGLAGGGSNADLAARLAAALSGCGGSEEQVVGAVVGKGCLKRSADGASAGGSDAAKKVTFVLEEEAEAEVGVRGRRRRCPRVMWSPVVAKTRGRQKVGASLPGAEGSGGERRRTRAQVGADSAGEGDAGEAGADAPVRQSRRNAVNLGAGDGVEKVAGAVSRNNFDKVEEEEEDVVEAVHRKRKRKTREDDVEDVHVSEQVGVSRRSTRLSGLLSGPAAMPSPVVEKKRGRRKAGDVKEQTSVEEQPAEVQDSSKTLRSGLVVVGPISPIVAESMRSRRKVQEEEPALQKIANVEISGRTTRSSSVAAAVMSPIVAENKRRRKREDMHSDGELPTLPKVPINAAPVTRILRNRTVQVNDNVVEETQVGKKLENKRQPSKPSTRSRRHQHFASSIEEESQEQVGAPCKAPQLRRSRQNHSEANVLLNNNTTSESSNWSRAPIEGNDLTTAWLSTLNAAKDGIEDGVVRAGEHVEFKKRKPRNGRAKVATSGGEIPFSDSSGKASAIEMQIEVLEPVRRLTRKSVVPSFLEHRTKGMHEDVEKQPTVKEHVRRSTRKSVVPAILEKERKGLTTETIPETHVRRPTRKSVVPAMLEKGRKGLTTEMIPEARVRRSMRKSVLPTVNDENNDHGVIVRSEDFQSAKSEEVDKQPTVKQPVRRLTWKSALPAMLEKEREGIPAEMNPDAHVIVRRSMRKSAVPMRRSDKGGDAEKQLGVKEPVRRSTRKSVVPDVFEKENKGLHGETKSEISVRKSVRKSVAPNTVDKENKDCSEMVSREESRVQTRNSQTGLQLVVQNDESLQRTTRNSSKLVISPLQSKPTASKGRPAKRLRIAALQEVMPVEEHKEDQIAYGARTSDMIEVATDLESGVLPFPAEEKSNLRDAQIDSKLEGTVVVESGLSCDKDVSNNLEFGSAVNSERTPSNSSLPDDSSMDHYQQLEILNGLLVDKSSEESAMCLENSDIGAGGSTEKPLFNLAIPDCKHAGALSEEAVHSMKNDAGRCSPNIKQSPIGLQFLFSQGNTEGSNTHNDIPSSEYVVDESDVHKDEWQVEQNISSEPDLYQGSHEDLIRAEENGVSFQQNNEQEGFTKSSHANDWVTFAQLDSSEDVNHIVREIIIEDVICKEKEKNEFVPSSDIAAPHEKSNANVLAENVSGVSEALFCNSQSSPIFDEVNLGSNSLQLESLDALDNRIAFSNTEVLHQDNKEECNVQNEGQLTRGIDASGISEAAPLEGSESGKRLLPAVETSALPDEQHNSKLDGDEFEEHTHSCGQDSFDIFGAGSVKNNISHLAKECLMDQEQELKLPNDLSAPKSHEQSAICQDESVIGSGICETIGRRCTYEISTTDHEECNEHNEDQVTPGIVASGMSEPALIEESESEMTLLPTAETSALPDEQLNAKLEGNEEHKDASYISDAGSVGNNILSSLKDSYMDPCHDEELSNDMPAPKSPEESAVCMDDSVSGSVGICQTSERRRVDEISTKLLSFKISSTGKGSYIAMDAPRSVKQGDKLSQFAVALLRNRENAPAAETDPLKPSTDSSVLKDSSTQVLQSISGKPRDVGLAADNPDNKLDMEQVQQDDVQVQEGTLEKTSLGSATPEYKHECGLLDEAELHSMKNDGCSSSVEQSPFGLQSLFLQESIEEPVEYVALALAGVQAEHRVGESKDYHVEYKVEKTPLPEPVSDHETHIDFSVVSENGDCLYNSQQDNEKEGLTKASHDQEQVASGQLDFLEAANCMKKDTNSEEVAYEDEENKKPMHSTDINSSCENLDANGSVEHASGISDALFSSSLIAATNDNDKVHLNSNPYQLESTDFLDEPIGCPNTEVLQQRLKEQCDEHKEDQVAYGARTREMIEADTAKDIESGVSPLPAEERSNLRDEQLNSKLEGREVVESGLSGDKDVSNILEFGSVVNSVGIRTPSDTSLPKDLSMDHYLQHELLNDLSVEKSPEESAMCWKNSDPRTAPATIEKPSFDLAIPDCKHEGVLSEEAVYSLKNDVERCSPDHKQSSIGLQFLFLQETMDGSDTHHALVLPSVENVDDSNTRHVDLPVEKVVSSESDSHQVSHEDLTRVEENGCCMFSSQLDDEQEGFSNSSHKKDWAASAQSDSSEEDVNHIEREEENKDFIPFSDVGTGHEKSHASEHAEHASGTSEASFYHKEKSNEHNDDQLTTGVDASGMSEAALIEGSESGMTLLPTAETSALPDVQLNPELEDGEFEEHNHSCDKDTSYIFGAGSVKNNMSHQDHKEAYIEHNEDQVTPGILASGKSEPALIEGSESVMTPLPAAKTSALPNEQRNPKLEGNKERRLSFDNDTSNISDTGSVENNNLSCLPKDACSETRHEQEHQIDMPAPKSPEESAICPNDSVPGSVGICQSTGRRRIDEISTKLLTFKISSTVKGSYIAMDTPSSKQGDNQSQSAIALLRNRENAPTDKTDHPPKRTTDRSSVKDSSRRALQTISGIPRDN